MYFKLESSKNISRVHRVIGNKLFLLRSLIQNYNIKKKKYIYIYIFALCAATLLRTLKAQVLSNNISLVTYAIVKQVIKSSL
jgi:hypothetical protein